MLGKAAQYLKPCLTTAQSLPVVLKNVNGLLPGLQFKDSNIDNPFVGRDADPKKAIDGAVTHHIKRIRTLTGVVSDIVKKTGFCADSSLSLYADLKKEIYDDASIADDVAVQSFATDLRALIASKGGSLPPLSQSSSSGRHRRRDSGGSPPKAVPRSF